MIIQPLKIDCKSHFIGVSKTLSWFHNDGRLLVVCGVAVWKKKIRFYHFHNALYPCLFPQSSNKNSKQWVIQPCK